jgi:hypothetical protein
MRKTIVCAIAIIALLIVAQAIRGRTVYQDQPEYKAKIGYDSSREADSTTIEYMVKRAKAKGLDRIVRGSPHREPVIVSGIDEAIDNFSVVIVTPLEKTTQIQFLGAGLETLYRCKITEKLNLNKQASCCAAKDLTRLVRIPPDSKIAEEEMYLYTWGGHIVIDGVEVVQEEFPDGLELGRMYLVFLAHDDLVKIGMPGLGGREIYEIQPDGQLVSNRLTSIPVANDMREKLGNSLSRLKDYIRKKSATAK